MATYICIYACNMSFLSPEFEGELGGIHGRAYREEREGRNVIILKSQTTTKTITKQNC